MKNIIFSRNFFGGLVSVLLTALLAFTTLSGASALAQAELFSNEALAAQETLVAEETLPAEEQTTQSETPVVEEETPAEESQTPTSEGQALEPSPQPAPEIETGPALAEETSSEPVVVEESAAPSEPAPSVSQLVPILTTDKPDYHPGETATIFGNFFSPLTNYVLKIFGGSTETEDYVETLENVNSDSAGSFTYNYNLDNFFRPFYTVQAMSGGNIVAEMLFTDAGPGMNLDQCQNGTLANLSTPCDSTNPEPKWGNGNINSNNSQYREGDGIPYRLDITGLTNGTWTVRLSYDFTKGGVYALDRITSYKLTQNSDPCSGLSNCNGLNPEQTITVPGEVATPDTTHPSLPNGGALDIAGTANALQPDDIKIAVWEYTSAGNLVSPQPSGSDIFVTQNGLSTGDSDREFQFKIGVENCPVNTGCRVMVGWTGHIASGVDWGEGLGASSISGAPFHMRVLGVDQADGTTGGNQDRSVQLSAIILPSTITIHKITNSSLDTTTQFTFNATGAGYSGFTLVGGSQNQQTVSPGSYTITEVTPSGWDLTDLQCSESGTGTSATENLSGKSVAITIGSGGGGNIDCTFTNTLQTGTIVIIKDTVPDDSQDFSFSGDLGAFSLDDDADGTLLNTKTFNDIVAGNYNVTEAEQTGFSLTGINCVDPTQNSSVDTGTRTAGINLAPGETVTCTFTNTKQGKILIDKVTNPTGSQASFEFDPSWSQSNFSLTDNATAHDSGYLNPGTYSVTEVNIPTGWVLTGTSCSDGSDPSSINLSAGETVTCTFTNTENATLIVKKDMVGGTDTFNFTGTPNGSISIDLGTIQTSVAPGQYVVTEGAVSGWDLNSIVCDDSNSTGNPVSRSATFNAEAGKTVTCTFTNTKRGHIIVDKVTLPSGDSMTFSFDAQGGTYADFFLTDAQVPNDQGLVPGTYSVTENAPTGWALTGLTCNDSNGSVDLATGKANINLEAGETVTCTYTNTKLGSISGMKFEDKNGNSMKDVGDSGLSGWTISLTGATNASVQTDVSGNYSFNNLLPGTYQVCETLQSGWAQTSPGSGYTCPDGKGYEVVLSAGQTSTGNDFGNFKLVSISGKKFEDLDGDGASMETGEPYLGGWAIRLYKDGTPWVLIGEQATDGTGSYSFTGLTAGTYKICEVLSDNWTQSFPTTGTNNSPNNLSEGPRCITRNVTTSGDNPNAANFGNFKNPKLTVIKHVINDNGGTTEASAFDIHVKKDGADVVGSPAAGSEAGTTYTLTPGTYAVSEHTPPAGYANVTSDQTNGDCDANGGVTLQSGDVKTCTITNDDQTAHLKLVKVVENDDGGNAQTTDFTLSATGPTPISGTGSVESDVNAGKYTLSETTLPGYTASSWSCVGGSQNGSDITLALGESATCTITNDDIAPKLTLIKNVIKDNGGTALPDDFLLTIGGNAALSGTPYTLDANTPYAINETQIPGYEFVSITGDPKCPDALGGTVTLDEGDDITCTITNDDQPGTLIVHKATAPSSDTTTIFPIELDDTPLDKDAKQNIVGGGAVSYSVNAGTYNVTEDVPAGWDMTGNTCENVEVVNGGTSECTITNTQKGHLVVQKTTLPSGNSQTFGINASGSGSITGGGLGTIADNIDKDYEVTPGTYSVVETVPSGWDMTNNTCSEVEVSPGETEYCEITNVKQGKITIVKEVARKDSQDFEFTFTGQPNFFLDDDEGVQEPSGVNQPKSKTFSNLQANTVYTVGEILPLMWEFQGVVCVNDNDSTPYNNFTVNGSSATINLEPGAEITCTFTNFKPGPTRTQGFWQTHTNYTSQVFNYVLYPLSNFTSGSMLIGNITHGKLISDSPNSPSGPKSGEEELFGAWYSNIAKTSTGKGKTAQRSDLDKARMQLLQQLVAAKLNCAAFGCSVAVQNQIANADSAYAGDNVSNILAAASQMDVYNNSGDTIILGTNPGNATPKASQQLADLKFWDTP